MLTSEPAATWHGFAAHDAKSPGTARPRSTARPIVLDEYERRALMLKVRSTRSTHFEVMQARIVLMAADGCSNRAIARRIAVKLDTVIRWRERFYRRRLDGLNRLPSGPPPNDVRGEWSKTAKASESARLEPSGKLDRDWTLIERAPPNGANPRASAVADLLPAEGRPPCFDSDKTWREYMEHAAAHTRHAGKGPVIWLRGAPRLNLGFNFCEDCAAVHQARMQALQRCDPGWLERVTL